MGCSRLNLAPNLALFGAGREKRVYAIPPLTRVVPLAFEDFPFEVERFAGQRCARCGVDGSYLVSIPDQEGSASYICSDSAWCDAQLASHEAGE